MTLRKTNGAGKNGDEKLLIEALITLIYSGYALTDTEMNANASRRDKTDNARTT
jgi:hypothetical protein